MLLPVHQSIAGAASARDVGRIMRDVLTELATTCSFALSLHHRERNEVAYRYRVASEDELGAFLRRETLDDGPDSTVARMDGWVRSHRPVRIGTRDTVVHTAQCPVRLDDATIGVLTLQSEGESLAESVLATVAELLAVAAPRLAELRETSAFRGA